MKFIENYILVYFQYPTWTLKGHLEKLSSDVWYKLYQSYRLIKNRLGKLGFMQERGFFHKISY